MPDCDWTLFSQHNVNTDTIRVRDALIVAGGVSRGTAELVIGLNNMIHDIKHFSGMIRTSATVKQFMQMYIFTV